MFLYENGQGKQRGMELELHNPLCNGLHMATNLQLDETLISEAQKLGKQPSKRATVEMALREYVQRRQQLKIVESFGQIDYDESYDYKAARRTRRK